MFVGFPDCLYFSTYDFLNPTDLPKALHCVSR